MSDRNSSNMAPGSLKDSAGPIHSLANMTITSHDSDVSSTAPQQQQTEPRVKITSPLPNGILFKGKKLKKSVSFRDSELVRIREIPPRSFSGDEESEDEDVVSSSDSEENSESDSETEEAASPQPPPAPVVNGHARPVTAPVVRTTPVVGIQTVSRATPPVTQTVSKIAPSTPVSTLTVRPERAPIPWTPVSTFTGSKGTAATAVSPAAKVVTLVSRMTGVSSSSAHLHTKPRSPVIPTTSSSSSSSSSSSAPVSTSHSPVRKPSSPVPPKKPPPVVRSAEKKTKRITPTLDSVMTSQTVRSVQKHGAVSETLHKGSSGKASKKKRVSRRQETSDRRKVTISRKTKDSKQNNNSKAAENSATSRQTVSTKRNVSSAGARPKSSVVNGFNHVRDSLSLPPLSSEDSALLNPSKLLQHRPQTKTSIYSMDGFIFPGDPTHELTTNLKAAAASPAGEDVKLKPQGPPAASGDSGRHPIPGHAVRDRVSSAPAGGSISRRKRFYAWQMANGNLQNSLHEPPSITPMWENMNPVPAPTPKPAYVTDR